MPNNTDIDFDLLVNEQLPVVKRKIVRVTWIHVLLTPFKIIFNDFKTARQEYLYKVAYNGQKNMLERILNDKFDDVSRGIYITNKGLVDIQYQFYEVEQQVDHYGYYLYDPSHTFEVNDRCVYGGNIYKSLVGSNSGNTPDISPSEWELVRPVSYRRYTNEYDLSGGFIVNVPSSVTFDEVYMRSLIEYYKLAGRPYEIKIV